MKKDFWNSVNRIVVRISKVLLLVLKRILSDDGDVSTNTLFPLFPKKTSHEKYKEDMEGMAEDVKNKVDSPKRIHVGLDYLVATNHCVGRDGEQLVRRLRVGKTEIFKPAQRSRGSDKWCVAYNSCKVGERMFLFTSTKKEVVNGAVDVYGLSIPFYTFKENLNRSVANFFDIICNEKNETIVGGSDYDYQRVFYIWLLLNNVNPLLTAIHKHFFAKFIKGGFVVSNLLCVKKSLSSASRKKASEKKVKVEKVIKPIPDILRPADFSIKINKFLDVLSQEGWLSGV